MNQLDKRASQIDVLAVASLLADMIRQRAARGDMTQQEISLMTIAEFETHKHEMSDCVRAKAREIIAAATNIVLYGDAAGVYQKPKQYPRYSREPSRRYSDDCCK